MILNVNGGVIAWVILYLTFQVGMATFVRILEGNENPKFTRSMYLKVLIPVFGVFIAVYYILKEALKKDVNYKPWDKFKY